MTQQSARIKIDFLPKIHSEIKLYLCDAYKETPIQVGLFVKKCINILLCSAHFKYKNLCRTYLM